MITPLHSRLDFEAGRIEGGDFLERRLSDLRGYFADGTAHAEAVERGDPLVYTVSSVVGATGDGALHYSLVVLMPGRVGREYYMTKGHYHAWRPAAEVYLGVRGEGVMLLEEQESGLSRLLPLRRNEAVYVPGHTAHRTVNTGDGPLVFLGVYPAEAGHDYATLAARNFRCVVCEQDGAPAMVDRLEFRPGA